LEKRIARLEAMRTRLEQMKKISNAAKTLLGNEIKKIEDELLALKEKIAASADFSEIKQEINSISKSYKAYTMVMPRAQLMSAAERINSLSDKLENIAKDYETRIGNVQSQQEQDSLKKTLVLMKTNIASARTKAQEALTALNAINTANPDKEAMKLIIAALKDARQKVKDGHKYLIDARKNAHDINLALKNQELPDKNKDNATTTED
jgi:mannose/fructose/N-acetylgalactosamine-specific phosphotransferase system component IIB